MPILIFFIREKEIFGGPERDRTADLFVANEALSQLSYRPGFQDINYTIFNLYLK